MVLNANTLSSLPTRERGLKLSVVQVVEVVEVSLPTRERGLKLQIYGLATLFWTKLLRTRNYFNYSSYPADFKVFNPLYSTGVR